jgi:uncharacterized repeat protein (TIGR03803 family)
VTNRVHAMTFLIVLGLAALAPAQTFTTLYNFCSASGCSDGGLPYAGVIQDSAGNLYGTTGYEGLSSSNGGVVFKLDTAGNETVLYSFCLNWPTCTDGARPYAPVIRDKAGNLYGTTLEGGSTNCQGGCGVVFKVDKARKETVLYSFTGGSDGCYPEQGLVMDKSGNLYGTTDDCGSSGYGTIFKVETSGKFTLLHGFAGAPSDGAHPAYGHLTIDASGNLYGVTDNGGGMNLGALYGFSKDGKPGLLHSFTGGADGCLPYGSVAQDKDGNLYGTTFGFDCNSQGTVWKVSKNGKESVLHSFAGGSSDGCNPYAGVALDAKNNLYGVTQECGANGDGAVYKLSAEGSLTLLHSFDGSDGANPIGEVLRTASGTLFGTTQNDGPHGDYGTVWSYVPK